MVTLRLAHSWTRWRRSRRAAKIRRAIRRLDSLSVLMEEQQALLQRLGHPQYLPPPAPGPEPTPEEQADSRLAEELTEFLAPEPTPEELPPMPPAEQEIVRLLGLPRQ